MTEHTDQLGKPLRTDSEAFYLCVEENTIDFGPFDYGRLGPSFSCFYSISDIFLYKVDAAAYSDLPYYSIPTWIRSVLL